MVVKPSLDPASTVVSASITLPLVTFAFAGASKESTARSLPVLQSRVKTMEHVHFQIQTRTSALALTAILGTIARLGHAMTTLVKMVDCVRNLALDFNALATEASLGRLARFLRFRQQQRLLRQHQ